MKKRRFSVKGTIVLCVVCLLLGTVLGTQINKITSPLISDHSSIYNEIAGILENSYLDTVDSELTVTQRIIKGMTNGLGDPYTTYMEPSEADDLTSSINASFVGIGVSYTKINDGGLILQVFKDSPADNAGVKAGDVITHIDGNEIKTYTTEKIKESILGKAGTQVIIRVLRQGEYQDITIIRNQVEASLEGEIKTVNDVLHGYILLSSFGDTTASLLEEQLKVFKSAGVENIIIDLRGNSGGYLTSVQNILDLFIDEGETLLSMEYNNEEKTEIKATGRSKYKFKNGIILIDGQSASSSEVMAAAMQELAGYTLIGTTTYGKGIVQTQIVLSDSSTLKYTHAKWLTPSGNCIHGVGVEPDIEVDQYTADDIILFNLDKEYKYDDVSEYVAQVQILLNKLGYTVDREDGYFSKTTEEQLKKFESSYHLEVNGILESKDLTVIYSNLVYHLTYNQTDTVYTRAVENLK